MARRAGARRLLRDHAAHLLFVPAGASHHALDLRLLVAVDHQRSCRSALRQCDDSASSGTSNTITRLADTRRLRHGLGADQRVQDGFEAPLAPTDRRRPAARMRCAIQRTVEDRRVARRIRRAPPAWPRRPASVSARAMASVSTSVAPQRDPASRRRCSCRCRCRRSGRCGESPCSTRAQAQPIHASAAGVPTQHHRPGRRRPGTGRTARSGPRAARRTSFMPMPTTAPIDRRARARSAAALASPARRPMRPAA